MTTKTFIVLEKWNNDGEYEANVFAVCATKEIAREELKKAYEKICEDWENKLSDEEGCEIEVLPDSVDITVLDDDYWYTATIEEHIVIDSKELKVKKESDYAEVRIDFYDEIDNVWCVDAWKSSNDNEEGKVVAKISDKGKVTYLDRDAERDPLVRETIENFLKDMEKDS